MSGQYLGRLKVSTLGPPSAGRSSVVQEETLPPSRRIPWSRSRSRGWGRSRSSACSEVSELLWYFLLCTRLVCTSHLMQWDISLSLSARVCTALHCTALPGPCEGVAGLLVASHDPALHRVHRWVVHLPSRGGYFYNFVAFWIFFMSEHLVFRFS